MWTALLSLFCFCLHGAANGSDKLLLVHALWRHGDRNPQEAYPNDPNKNRFPEGFGSLTDIGAKQHKELGQWLKQRYVDEHRLISSKYGGKYVYVRSTNVSRTIKSAKNNMLGMFNTVPNNKIPVEPRNKDKNLLPYSSCERSLQYRKMIERTDTYKAYVQSIQPLLDRLSKLSGKEQSFWRLNMLTDTLFIRESKRHGDSRRIEQVVPERN
ncbi:putative esophageal gland cell secretory protein 21 [Aphelenchoides bicaudatus]|nr:putative esophageal gland cell secretory protein 21 [Aphelenchoides bicaudatus]